MRSSIYLLSSTPPSPPSLSPAPAGPGLNAFVQSWRFTYLRRGPCQEHAWRSRSAPSARRASLRFRSGSGSGSGSSLHVLDDYGGGKGVPVNESVVVGGATLASEIHRQARKQCKKRNGGSGEDQGECSDELETGGTPIHPDQGGKCAAYVKTASGGGASDAVTTRGGCPPPLSPTATAG